MLRDTSGGLMQPPEALPAEAIAQAAMAGEFLIRAAAAIGTLPAATQQALDLAGGRKIIAGLGIAMQGLSTVAPALIVHARCHPPQGFIGRV